MSRDRRSYSQAMQAYEDEKKFLRKIRHRAFHPDVENPLLMRLGGYLIRLIVLVLVVGGFLFIKNRGYFQGEAFSETLQAEFDHFFHGEESDLTSVIWKNDQATMTYKAEGGPRAFFREIELDRVMARAKWSDLLLNEGWNLQEVQIGRANVFLKGGPTPGEHEPITERTRSTSFMTADPDFSRTRFGDVRLHEANFSWGPFWTSKGQLSKAKGLLWRHLGDWKMTLEDGVLSQNWLKDLKMVEDEPLKVTLADNQINISNGVFTLGEAGKVRLEGIIRLGEEPEFDFRANMKTIDLIDVLPKAFHGVLAGFADFQINITGSPNRSDGIIVEGIMTMVEGGRFRDIPILQTLSVVTPRTEMRLMPIRTGSRFRFKTRQGRLTVLDMDILGGGAHGSRVGFESETGEVLEFARINGSFSYQMDTTELDKALKLDSIKRPIEEEDIEEEAPDVGFKGEVRIGMPWPLFGKEESYREKHFTLEDQYGWITVPLEGPLDEITVTQATAMDHEWGELAKQPKNVFE